MALAFSSPILALENDVKEDSNEDTFVANIEGNPDDSEVEPEKPSIVLDKNSAILELGQTFKINAKLSPEIFENETLIYKSMDEKIASVNSDGLITGKGLGKTKIMVTFVANEPLETVFSIEVNPISGSINFKEDEFYLIRGLSYQIPYTINGNFKSENLKWISSDPTVAIVESGKITGKKLGKTTISAEYGTIRSNMTFYVTAPVEKIEFTKDVLNLSINESQTIPSLIYVPYDTTSNKTAQYRSSDETIFIIEGNKVQGKSVGEAFLISTVGSIETRIPVNVNHQKSPTGADLMDLVIESQNDNQMFLIVNKFDKYESNRYALNFPKEEIINLLDKNDNVEIFIVLEDSFIEDNFKNLDNLLLDFKILEGLSQKKLSVHLLDSNNNPLMIYHFSGEYTHGLDLKFSIEPVSERNVLYQKIQGKSYFLKFNRNNQDSNFKVELSSNLIDSGFSQMHFIYQIENQELIDTKQDVIVNSQDRIVFDVNETEQVITFNRLAISSSNNMVYWMLGILVVVGVGISAYYINQMKKNRNV